MAKLASFTLVLVFVILVHSKYGHRNEKSEEDWKRVLKEYCEENSEVSQVEIDEENGYNKCIQENDQCLSDCIKKVYSVYVLPTDQEEMNKLICKGDNPAKKFVKRDECFDKCDDPSGKVEKYCSTMFPESSTAAT